MRWDAVPTLFFIPNPPKLITLARKRRFSDVENQPPSSHSDHLYGKPLSNIDQNEVRPRLNTAKQPTSIHFDHSYGKRCCIINDQSSCLKETTICKSVTDSETCIYLSGYDDFLQVVPTNTGIINEFHIVVGHNNLSQEVPSNSNESRPEVDDSDCSQEVTMHVCINESETIVDLKRKVKHLQILLRLEKKRVVQLERNLNRFLNDDRVQQLKSASTRTVKWSNDTIKSSLKIRCATGAKGYTYLRSVGYPLPSYTTLCNRVENAQFRPGIHHDVLEWLKVKVESLPSMGKDCILAIDEMQVQPTVQYDKGNILYTFVKYTATVEAVLIL